VPGGPYRLALEGVLLPGSFCGPMGDFLASVEKGREPTVSARRNLATLRQVLAEHRSAQEGGIWVEVEGQES
jgi:predicted dehydrogenase